MIENNKTQVQFQLCTNKSKLGTPAAGNIVFIQDTKELYLDGIYYGLSTTDAETLATAVTDISTLKSNVGDYTSITKSLVQIVTALRSFADGDTLNANGPALTTYADGHILHNVTNVKGAIDALATAVNSLNGKSWTAVTKDAGAGQFATSVEQGTDGSITVTYGNVNSADVNRTSTQEDTIAGSTVEAALGTLKGLVDAAQSKANANESAITTLNGDAQTTGSVAKAVNDAKTELIGTGANVWSDGELKTLTYLRDLIKSQASQISALQGVDSNTASTLTAIINELKTAGENGDDFASTLLDKFLALYGSPTNGEYDVNNGKAKTLQAIINAIETEISNLNTTLSSNITSTIEGLDATERGQLTSTDAVESGKHVGVKVVETDGKITNVTVVESDIASATALGDLTTTVNNLSSTVESQGSQLTWTVIS